MSWNLIELTFVITTWINTLIILYKIDKLDKK
jgi:hypothetical protein